MEQKSDKDRAIAESAVQKWKFYLEDQELSRSLAVVDDQMLIKNNPDYTT